MNSSHRTPARRLLAPWCAAALVVATINALPAQNVAASATPNPEEKKDSDVVQMEPFEVTGSRIKRIDAETPAPVIQLDRVAMQSTGFTTVGDALRALPIISGQSLNSIDGGTSFTPGTSSINLRGLGNNNTLVLINGRRAAPYGSPGFDGFQVVFDFNSIPTAALDSIEILKDGGSAIYGSDAVAGVVNIKLRQDYRGLSLETHFGNTSRTDSFEKGVHAIFGTAAGKTSIVTTFDWNERNAIYARDLPWTNTANGAPIGGFDQRSSANVIANVRGLTGLAQFPNGHATFNTPQTNPTLANAVNTNNFYNFQEDAQMFPDTRQFGFYTRAAHDISDSLRVFAEYSTRRSEITIDAAPTPLFSVNENGDSAIGTILFPATNPFNPFGQNITDLRWRMRDVGNRINDVVTDVPRIVVGLEGDINPSWSWDTGVLYTKATTTNRNLGTVFDGLTQDAFNGVEIDGQTLYLNPFGPNDPRILDYISGENPNTDSYEVRSIDFSVTGKVFELPHGPVGLALGGEYRTEEIATVGTIANVQGQVVGGSESTNTFGDRKVHALYAETTAPIFKQLEVQLAARWEDYSDFGTATKPKIAAKYRILPQLLVRASYGESFLAPNLPFLFTSQGTSFSAGFLRDPLRPDLPAQQIRQRSGGNPDLLPEETEVTYGGFVVSPFTSQKDSLFESLTFNLDFFRFNQKNLIDSLDADEILGNIDLFGDLVIRQPPEAGQTIGQIDFVRTDFQNLVHAQYKGVDLGATWEHTFGAAGQFRANVSATFVDTFTQEGTEFASTYNVPEWRGNGTVAWSKGDWSASMYVTYVGSYGNNPAFFDDGSKIKAQWRFNPQVAYRGLFDTTITVGARNVFDSAPPVDLSDTTLTNPALNDIEPLFWYVRLGRDF